LFFPAADDVDVDARRARIDLDLLLALAGAALLALGAASPVWTTRSAVRTIRVVVDAGPAMAARAPDGTAASSRADAAVEAIRSRLASDDVLDRVDASGGGLVAA